MKPRAFFILLLAPILTGCASVPEPKNSFSDAKAIAILKQSAEAQGYPALNQLHDVEVSFQGTWSWIVPRVQPVLVDIQFRGNSVENYLVKEESTTQTHTGPGGIKRVVKTPADIHVFYNDKESTDTDVKDAAALVIDDYRMFLFGPAFFLQRQAPVQYLDTETVDGFACDNILAILKPGLGHSPGDRAIVSIDQTQHYIRRVRITVEGMQSTQGAVADIFLRDQIKVDGVVFPTRFYEELKKPFDASVHNWRLIGIWCDK